MRDKLVPCLLAAALTAVMLSACGAPGKMPEDRYYRLSLPTVDAVYEPVFDGVLVIGTVTAYDVYRDRAIAYRPPEEPGSLQHHHYHFWVAPPPELVLEQLVDYLRGAGVARVVSIESARRGKQAMQLAARLTHFERVLHRNGNVSFAVGLEVTLDNEGEVRLRQRYDGTTKAADASFTASVRAAEEGLGRIYRELAGDIAAVLDGTRRR